MSELLYSQISNSNIKSSRQAWHEILIDYFEFIISKEDKIDSIRNSLCSETNFNPKKLFEYIDKRNKKNITLNDLILILEENKINYKEENLRKLIHNFDKDNDFCLDYNEFIGLILPRKNKLLQKNFITSFQYNNDFEININIKNHFCNLLLEEMKLIEGCDVIIKKIQDFNGFTPYEAFLDILNGDEIYINENNLGDFLIKNNIKINEEDVTQIMFRLDRDNDGKISYEEFQNIFLTMNNNSYNNNINQYNIINNENNEYFNIQRNLNEENNNYDIFTVENNIQNDFNINNYQKKNNNNYNKYFEEDVEYISPIRNDKISKFNKIKKDINFDYNKDININLEENSK